jgi:hypothetical protein
MENNTNATPATLSNSTAPLALINDIIVTHGAYENAATAFAASVDKARAGGIKSVDLAGRPAGQYYLETKVMVAQHRLNAEESALWSDKSVKQTKGSPKQAIDVKLNNVVDRIRKALALRETDAATAVATGKPAEPAKKGKPAKKTSFKDLCGKELQACYTRAAKEEEDMTEFQTALMRAADVIMVALKDK